VSADIFTTATELAILLAGRTPVWSTEANTGSNLPPSSLSSGVYLQRAVRALVHVSLRQNAAYRSALLTTSATLSGIYTVTIGGTAVTFNATGAPNLAAVVDGIVAAINANGTVNQIVVASPLDTPHARVQIVGIVEADYSVDFSHSGAATLTALADYCVATMRPWWLPAARVGSTPPQIWAWSGDTFALDRRGFVERFDSAGLDRLHVQLSDRIGHAGDGSIVTYVPPVISIGPCLSETDA
jgi:hypothetical protein